MGATAMLLTTLAGTGRLIGVVTVAVSAGLPGVFHPWLLGTTPVVAAPTLRRRRLIPPVALTHTSVPTVAQFSNP